MVQISQKDCKWETRQTDEAWSCCLPRQFTGEDNQIVAEGLVNQVHWGGLCLQTIKSIMGLCLQTVKFIVGLCLQTIPANEKQFEQN